jgi:hypothetical protein
MAFWKKLEDDLSKELSGLGGGTLAYRGPHQSIIEFDYSGFHSDGCLSDCDHLLAVEVEAGQPHADTNTAKYWFVAQRSHHFKRIVLLHIYTPDFKSYGSRKDLADFLAEKIKTEIDFDQIDLDYRDKMANDYEFVLKDAKERIGVEFRKLFGGT